MSLRTPLTATLAAAGALAAAAALPTLPPALARHGSPTHARHGSHARGRHGSRRKSRVLFHTRYPRSGDAVKIRRTGWKGAQVPDDRGRHEDCRIKFGRAPGPGERHRPSGPVARFTLHPFRTHGRVIGDRTDTGGYVANRVEVYGRIAHRQTPARRWPDPIGSTRWYSFSVYIPTHFLTATRPTQWFDFVQWKGLDGGSPPVAMEIRGDQFVLGGANSDAHLGYIHKGTWSHFVVGLHFSDTSSRGWATVYRNGRRLVHHQPTQTVNAYWIDGVLTVDPDYLKMGIYRSVTWTRIQRIWLSSLTIGTTLRSVR